MINPLNTTEGALGTVDCRGHYCPGQSELCPGVVTVLGKR